MTIKKEKTIADLGKCPKCGCAEIYVDESLTHRAGVKDGKLEVYKCFGNEITLIYCSECSAEFTQSDFEEIEFC